MDTEQMKAVRAMIRALAALPTAKRLDALAMLNKVFIERPEFIRFQADVLEAFLASVTAGKPACPVCGHAATDCGICLRHGCANSDL